VRMLATATGGSPTGEGGSNDIRCCWSGSMSRRFGNGRSWRRVSDDCSIADSCS
jgi:hypothetical protein